MTRPLALEARAHVVVQCKIDGLFKACTLISPTNPDFCAWVHHAFYTEMPPEFRFVRQGGQLFLGIVGRFDGQSNGIGFFW